MAVRCEKVILCKGSSENNEDQDSYVATLKSAGYSCIYLKTLSFEFININELRSCLSTPDVYHGLVLTSRRAAEAIKHASKGHKDLLEPWKDMETYCVGPATESFARDSLGLHNCLGSDSGNAENLSKVIIENVQPKSKPLLYPCSAIARDVIENALNSSKICFKKFAVYQTCGSESLENDLLKLLDGSPKIFVFFSPSTVKHVSNLLKNYHKEIDKIKTVAIGPVTAQAITDVGLKLYATAEKPDPVSLTKAIVEADKEIN